MVHSLALYEPALVSVLPADSDEGKAAREDRTSFDRDARAAARAGDSVQAARLFIEGVFQLGSGGFHRLPPVVQTRVLDNARVMPLFFAAQELRSGDDVRHVAGSHPAHARHARREDAEILRLDQ